MIEVSLKVDSRKGVVAYVGNWCLRLTGGGNSAVQGPGVSYTRASIQLLWVAIVSI